MTPKPKKVRCPTCSGLRWSRGPLVVVSRLKKNNLPVSITPALCHDPFHEEPPCPPPS